MGNQPMQPMHQPPADCAQPGAVYNPQMGSNMGMNQYGQPVPPPDCSGLANLFAQIPPPAPIQPDPNCASCESKDLPFDPRCEAPPGFPEFAGVRAGYIEAYM